MATKGLMKGLQENIPDLEEPCPMFFSLTKAAKIPGGSTTDFYNFAPGFMLHTSSEFSNVKNSVVLPRMLWLYVLLMNTPLYFQLEEKFHLLTSHNLLSLH